ncbi:helix-turn-helix transcriptional regulator [Pseudaquidulcibacter saccharophilus]|uniref:helix-turn-helix transcriptional regulator n=1 Tax=Pseudaquidulcibacter saccharophilus TaxID=2831900 RepID=UPI001EFF0BA0|nr:helix-turn-helix domain-containing protein [Pseudaquidulcibacter saccharophilus]
MAEIEKLLTGREAAEILKLSEQTLRIQRIKGSGAKYVKVGRLVRYRQSDLEAYLDARTFENTSQMGA